MNKLVEGTHTGEFLISEGNGQISRERVTIVAGPALVPGQLLASAGGGKYKPYVNKAGGDAVAVLYGGLPQSDADRDGAGIVRDAEVLTALLVGIDVDAGTALAAKGIILR
nr:MAG TPA: head decoration protein D [Caudoviricetes sp.]